MTSPFERSCKTFDAILASERANAAIDPICYPQLLHHGRRTAQAIVFFHGFTNCPAQLGEIARAAHARGANVYVPRLPKHGFLDKETTALESLLATKLEAMGLESVELATGLGEHVDVLGLSVGGTLAAWLAQTCAIGTAIAVAPFFSIKAVPAPLEPLLEGALERLPDFELWWDPKTKANNPQTPQHGYPRFATHALAESLKLGDDAVTRADVVAPLARRMILATNADDPAVNNDAARVLWDVWRKYGVDASELALPGLGKRHDIIEPQTFPQARELVYPTLLDALLR